MGLLDQWFGPPSREKFARLFMDALKAAGDQREMRYETEQFRLLFGEEAELGVLNLANLYVEYSRVTRAERKQYLREMVRAALSHLKEMPTEFDDASYDIRPRLWTRATFEQLKLRQRLETGNTIDWPLEPVGDHLYLSLVYDLPESVRSISQEDLEQWGVSFWQAREVAIRNLQETKFVYASVGDELYASNTGDSYDATRLILTELFEDLNVAGQPIAMVPNRDTLLVTGTESEVGQKMMLEFAMHQLSEQPRPMIATPLVLGPDGSWADWKPGKSNPLYRQYLNLEYGWLQVEYEEQRELLIKLHEREKNSDHVAQFFVAEKDDGLESLAVWVKDTCAIMPITDVVIFKDAANPDFELTVRFEEVAAHLSGMMEPVDTYPPRYRVFDFPGQSQLARMQTA